MSSSPAVPCGSARAIPQAISVPSPSPNTPAAVNAAISPKATANIRVGASPMRTNARCTAIETPDAANWSVPRGPAARILLVAHSS